MKNIKKEVLESMKGTSETGRYFIYSSILDKTFCVEPIDDHPDNIRSDWGDVNPATKKIEGSYGEKNKGSIKMKESIIKVENGFENDGIFLKVGESPQGYVEMMEREFINKKK